MIYLGADHAGFKLKEDIKKYFDLSRIQYQDLGNKIFDSQDDFPDFAYRVAMAVARHKNAKGILFCGTGQGMALAANKVKGAYAVFARDKFTSRHASEHSLDNILTLGSRGTSPAHARVIVGTWLRAKPLKQTKYLRRFNKIKKIERNNFKKSS